MLELRILTPLLDWKRWSEALSRHQSYDPRFEVQMSLRATAFSMSGEEICSVVLRELLDVRVEPLNCAGPVQPGGCRSRMRSVLHSKFPCPRNSRPCTSS